MTLVALRLLRLVRLLTVVVWLGGLIFFAFVLAPTAFSPVVIERTRSLFVSGTIVGIALGKLHWMGLSCGAIFLVATVVLSFRRRTGARLLRIEVVAVAAMMMLTAYSQFSIIPRMEQDRKMVGEIDGAAPGNAYRAEFDRLHHRSEEVEGGVMLAGLVLAGLLATE
jgi:uncharacterized membrane protein